MKFERKFTVAGTPVADQIEWEVREASIPGAGFHMPAVEVPKGWSRDASNILAQKYLRKAGVPPAIALLPMVEPGMPEWLWRRALDNPMGLALGGETSARQCFHRMAGCWTYWGWREGYFNRHDCKGREDIPQAKRDEEENARTFYDDLFWMLAMQYAAPNSPQWFNTGLWWAYGIEGTDSGQWAILKDYPVADGGQVVDVVGRVFTTYGRPQVHACFLTPTTDDLVNPGGIMDTWAREAKIFKQGSGSGVNVSAWRAKGELLSGGGVASGVMSFLRIGDSAAGAIQSGGTTRRAAKMICLDANHPEVEEFVEWKPSEEAKAAAMYVGSQVLHNHYSMNGGGEWRAPLVSVPDAVIDRMKNGFEPEVFGIDWEGEAIRTVDGQNSNNSVRVTDDFMGRVERGELWELIARTTGEVVKQLPSRDLWLKICRAAWASADPGLLFHTTINAWNTCANDGEIRNTNPCSEFMHLDGSACDLASLNLCKFADAAEFNCDTFGHACRLWTVVLDISVSMAGFPAREFAEAARDYRTLGLGYANLGGLLAQFGLRYDSNAGRALAAAVTALMTGVAYRTSAEIATELGPFPRWEANAAPMQAVLAKHFDEVGKLRVDNLAGDIVVRAYEAWKIPFDSPFRNAQVTLLAPTGTIALVMDCSTTGVEPFYSRSSVKQLAGGGSMAIDRDVLDEDCAVPSRPGGQCLSPEAHVKMVAEVQPFLSGGVSKTINMPHDATVEDVDHVYRLAHRLGLKSVALYRDGSKLTQPLATSQPKTYPQPTAEGVEEFRRHWNDVGKDRAAGQSVADQPELGLRRGDRRELPSRRPRANRWKLEVGGQSVYISTGDHEDGELGEIFVGLSREGSDVRSMMECFSKVFSIALQHGVPLGTLVDAFIHTKFEPAGVVAGDTRVRICSSLPDLIVRHLAVEYLGRDDLASVPRVEDAEAVVELAKRIAPELRRATHSTPSMVMLAYACRECGSHGTLRRTGTCVTCSVCGYNEGCG